MAMLVWRVDETTAPAESQGAEDGAPPGALPLSTVIPHDLLSETHPLVHFSIQVVTSPQMPTQKRRPSRESWRS